MAKAEALNHLGLHRRGLLVDHIGSERLADDYACWPRAFRLPYELGDSFGDIMGVRRILALEDTHEELFGERILQEVLDGTA